MPASATKMARRNEDEWRNRLQAQACMQYLMQQPVSCVDAQPVDTKRTYWGPSLLELRIDRITRCVEELARCRRDYKVNPLAAQIGELDWLEELHAQLYV